MKKTLQNIAVSSLTISALNGRSTRAEEQVAKLAERMKRNGFEVTRALWATSDGAVFAGGTRLLAAREAGLSEVPVYVHDDASDDEIVKLAAEDNENDEYHVKVPVTDVWASYAALAARGWTQQRIADAMGCAKSLVSERISWAVGLCGAAREACSNGTLDEGHIRELSIEVLTLELAPWLATAQAQTELTEEILTKHRGSSVGVKPTVKTVREAARLWKEWIAAAEKAFESFEETDRVAFVEELVKRKARSLAVVESAAAVITKTIAKRKADELALAEGADLAARKAAEQAEREQSIVSKIVHGDARALVPSMPSGAKLLLTDPPYGMAFQSGRRVTSANKKKIEADDSIGAAVSLITNVLSAALPRMAEDAHALIFTGWRYEPEFRRAIEAAGWRVQQSLVWVKNNHGTGALETTFAPKHERMIYAVKGKPSLIKRHPDVLVGKDSQNSWHPTEKPRDLLRQLIEATTQEGDLVVDPFAGSGNTLLEALSMGRDAWGCELDDEYHAHIADALLMQCRSEAA